MSIGPFRFDKKATPALRTALEPVLTALDAVMGDLIEEVFFVFKPPNRMPFYAPGKRAYGIWKGYEPVHNRREIWLRDDVDTYFLTSKLVAHEVCHVIDDDWMNRDQRRKAINLMSPKPLKWRDTVINGRDFGYIATPFETFATYASTALLDFTTLGYPNDVPAYTTLYLRSIDQTDWPALRQIILGG